MELSKKIYDKQFTTVTTHKNVQNYYNEKRAKYLTLYGADSFSKFFRFMEQI